MPEPVQRQDALGADRQPVPGFQVERPGRPRDRLRLQPERQVERVQDASRTVGGDEHRQAVAGVAEVDVTRRRVEPQVEERADGGRSRQVGGDLRLQADDRVRHGRTGPCRHGTADRRGEQARRRAGRAHPADGDVQGTVRCDAPVGDVTPAVVVLGHQDVEVPPRHRDRVRHQAVEHPTDPSAVDGDAELALRPPGQVTQQGDVVRRERARHRVHQAQRAHPGAVDHGQRCARVEPDAVLRHRRRVREPGVERRVRDHHRFAGEHRRRAELLAGGDTRSLVPAEGRLRGDEVVVDEVEEGQRDVERLVGHAGDAVEALLGS